MRLTWEVVQANAIAFSKRWKDAKNEEADAYKFVMGFLRGLPAPPVFFISSLYTFFKNRHFRPENVQIDAMFGRFANRPNIYL